MPDDCVVSFDNVFTIRKQLFRAKITELDNTTMLAACQVMNAALGCV